MTEYITIKVPEQEKEFKFKTSLYQTLEIWIRALVKKNQDLVVLFDGKEGAGKSVFMRQFATACQQILREYHKINVPFNADNIHFMLKEYVETCHKHEDKMGWIHILDESRAVANRKRSMSTESVLFTNYMSESRSCNHIHLIALPAYHDIDSNIAIWRCVFVVHMEKYFNKDGDLQLGNYKVFMQDAALKNTYYHKLKYIYPRKAKITGKSEYIEVLDKTQEKVYDDKKADARRQKFFGEQEQKAEDIKQYKKKIAFVMFDYGLSQGQVGRYLLIKSRSMLSAWYNEWKNAEPSVRPA